jgi:hypothetical protein
MISKIERRNIEQINLKRWKCHHSLILLLGVFEDKMLQILLLASIVSLMEFYNKV